MTKPIQNQVMGKSFRGTPMALKLNEVQSNDWIIPSDVQFFKVGTFTTPGYGTFSVTPEVLTQMKENFEKRVRGIDIAIDYAHESDKEAAGWVRELYLAENGKELWGRVQWTNGGKKRVSEKEFRYISPDFVFQYEDNESLQKHGAVLLGAGLTNRPVIKGMTPAIELMEENGSKQLQDDGALQACVSDLIPSLIDSHEKSQAIAIAFSKCRQELGIESAEERKKFREQTLKEIKEKKGGTQMVDQPIVAQAAASPSMEELLKKIADLEAKVAALSGEKDMLMKEKDAMYAEKKMAEKTATFEKLLSEGKLCAAQKEAFMSGDVLKLAETAQSVKTAPVGTSATPAEVQAPGTGSTEDAEDKILKLAEAKVTSKEAKSLDEAISLVLSENAELKKQYEQK